jgi:hypothetical protein
MQHFLRKTCSKFGDWACSGSEEVEKVKTIGIYRCMRFLRSVVTF